MKRPLNAGPETSEASQDLGNLPAAAARWNGRLRGASGAPYNGRMIDLILGTAGHIDHGKTSLVKALTGVDTDRLPEEKRRGITIDLGFAELVLGEYRLGIVDVPGHERFVRNMLAGATGIDLALLVVAADDSVKPQTEEHLEILRLLELDAGVIAITKCDLADPGWIELVEDEVRERTAGTFLAEAPLVRTSVATGQGLDQLRAALTHAARRAAASPRRSTRGPFRMPIDRAFTIAGHGAVVTGSVVSGRARVGDELVVEPGGTRVRVRGLENHGRAVDEVHRGQRAAINLAGMHHGQFDRGQELSAPGHLVPDQRFSVRLDLLASAPRPLKHRAKVRLHIGTAELMAGVALLDRDRLEPGEEALAQLVVVQPAVATWGQPFVVRSESPVATIGGGVVLDPGAATLRRNDAAALARLAQLGGEDRLQRAAAAVYLRGWRAWEPADLARLAGIDDGESAWRRLVERGELVEIRLSPQRTARVHRQLLEDLDRRIEESLAKMHDQSPLCASFDRFRLASRFAWVGDGALVDAVLASMAAAQKIELGDKTIALAGRGPRLSSQEQKLLEQVLEIYRQSAFQPPTVEEVKSRAPRNQAIVPSLVVLAAQQGRLVRISPEFYLHAQTEARMRQVLAERLSGGQGLTVSQIREILGTSRKYAVPLCEYLDRIGFTVRRGDLRFACP